MYKLPFRCSLWHKTTVHHVENTTWPSIGDQTICHISWNLAQEFYANSCWESMNFMHIRTVKGTLYLGVKMKYFLHFLCLLSNLDEILNRHPQSFEWPWVLWFWHSEIHTLESILIYICTLHIYCSVLVKFSVRDLSTSCCWAFVSFIKWAEGRLYFSYDFN